MSNAIGPHEWPGSTGLGGRARRTALCDTLVLQRDSVRSLQDQLFEYLRESIVVGRLRRGRRLPSSRQLASSHGISRTTVVQTYERLAAEGYVEARPRAGIFVAEVLPDDFLTAPRTRPSRAGRPAPPAPPAAPARPTPEARSPSVGPDRLALAAGVPAVDQFPWRAWRRLSAAVLREETARVIGWSDPRGEWPLREAIAEYLGEARGITCTADQVVVASGSRPLVEMAVRGLAVPASQVWFEEPGDPASRAVLEALGLKAVPVPVDAEGLDVEQGRAAAPDARLAVVAPSHHYPLGVTMSLERRRALLDWAVAHDAYIIENEIDGDFRFTRSIQPPIYSLDSAERTLYLGSFNKSLAPGLRIGYAVVPAGLAAGFRSTGPMVSVHHQLLLARFWAKGHFVSHLRFLREVHARRRAVLIEALRSEASDVLTLETLPQAGLRLPVTLSRNMPDGHVARACNVRLNVGRPISACYAAAPQKTGLILGFAATPEDRIRPVVRQLAAVIRAQAHPERA